MTKKATIPPVLVLVLIAMLSICSSHAQIEPESPAPLDRKLATRLIADFYDMGVNDIRIAYILDGRSSKRGFEAKVGAEATFILPVVEDGRRRRVIRSLQFQYDSTLGWFLQESIKENGREYVDICSEHQGRIRIE